MQPHDNQPHADAPSAQVPAYLQHLQPVTPPAPVKTNVLAIIGLITAVLVPFVGIIISILALKEIKRTQEAGHGLAIAGIVVAAIQLVLTLVAVIFIGLLYRFNG